MAFYGKQKKEHDFRRFQRDLKEDKFGELVLFCGEEEYKIFSAAQFGHSFVS